MYEYVLIEVFKIGKKITACILILVMMAVIPFSAYKCSNIKRVNNTVISKTENNEKEDKSDSSNIDNYEIISGITAALCNKDYCDEALKATAILISTDYSVKPEHFDLDNDNIFMDNDKIDNSNKEYYSKVENIVNNLGNLYLSVKNKKVFIPYSKATCGYTYESDDCKYIISVASPWDCFSKEYREDTECVGVSLYGINYLCENGATAKQALKWYLPLFELCEK